MHWLFRPSILSVLLVALALSATVLVLWQRSPGPAALPLEEGDQEIVWLYSATSAATWERFVTAVNTAAGWLRGDYPDLEVQAGDRAFPPQTTTVPELALALRGRSARLVFRWYKLTSDQTTEHWVERLIGGRRRPPLAIIGGASSDLAIEQAQCLSRATDRHPDVPPPLLILTTATAERIQRQEDPGRGPAGPTAAAEDPQGPLLHQIYPKRTYRFCFNNRQMAEAVTGFIFGDERLRPDTDPVYMVLWEDDAYSRDLTGRFAETLRRPLLTRAAARNWACLAVGQAAAGGSPLGLASACGGALPMETRLVSDWIDFSVGSFDQPNRWEAVVVRRLMKIKLGEHAAQQRPLLVLPAASSGPARRFLRGLVRASPVEARRFVVATGDGLAFNTVYRDRNVAWPIQDLPLDLVFFCHRNPVDPQAGFRAEAEKNRAAAPGPGSSATGTEDLLLYVDIVKALVHAAYQGEGPPQTGDELRQRLSQARWTDKGVGFGPGGRRLFDDDGNRRTGTGEHIVWLHPLLRGEQVLPQATLSVWYRPTDGPASAAPWQQLIALPVDYDIGVEAN
ncbi:MAG TPA: hypothetical protein VNK04_15390 [Gemmataceae bacterium]|nr:hypothetical protein [Gemmataceae bacterium]